MYITLFLLVGITKNATAQSDIAFNEKYENKRLSWILKKVSKKYQVKFAYSVNLIRKKRVSGQITAINIEQGVSNLLMLADLTYIRSKQGKFLIIPVDHPNAPINSIAKKIEVSKRQILPLRFNFLISGTIRDKYTGENLPFAHISVKHTPISTSANVEGNYVIEVVPNDTCKVIVSYLGYHNKVIFLQGNSSKSQSLDFDLEPSNIHLHAVEFEIDAPTPELIKMNNDHLMIDQNLNKVVPQLAIKDPIRTFQLLPGIDPTQSLADGLRIRGNSGERTRFFLDGIPLYQLDHFFGMFSTFNPHIIKSAQIYKSNYQTKYDGGLAGVANLTGISGDTSLFQAQAEVNSISSSLSFQIPLKKASLVSSIRTTYNDVIENPLYNSILEDLLIGNEDEKDQEFIIAGQDASFSDHYHKLTIPQEKNKFSFTYFSARDQLFSNLSIDTSKYFFENDEFDDELNEDEKQELEDLFNSIDGEEQSTKNTNGFGFNWFRQWTAQHHSTLLISGSKYNHRINKIALDKEEESSNSLSNKIIRFDHTFQKEHLGKLNFGIEFNNFQLIDYYEINWDELINTPSFNEEFSFSTSVASIYSELNKSIHPQFDLLLGARFNVYENNHKSVNPRFRFTYKPIPKLNFSLEAGRYEQLLHKLNTQSIFSLSRVNTWWIQGDSPFISNSWNIGLNALYKINRWNLQLEFYQNRIHQINEVVNYLDTTIHYNQELKQGIDFLASYHYNNWNSLFSLSLNQSSFAYEEHNVEALQYIPFSLQLTQIRNWKKFTFSGSYLTHLLENVPNGIRLTSIWTHKVNLSTEYKAQFLNKPLFFNLSLINAFDQQELVGIDQLSTKVSNNLYGLGRSLTFSILLQF